ncbi:MAG: hypothetical protein M1816_003113 [Peltula sp. TS41687]|nr:MAG: hypothetical protein M1816_003113 [Peltula sp. TS41687]
MDDDVVVAYIYPAALDSLLALHASPLRGTPQILNRRDREPTVDEEEHDALEYEACIKVTFSHIPKTRFGLRTGWSEDVELCLAPLPAVGHYHFALTFDDNYCLVVRDLGTTCGTAVVYRWTEQGRWSSFDWIVGGSDYLRGLSPIIVKVSRFLQLQLVVPPHNIQDKSYREKVDRFRAGMADIEDLLDLGRVGLLSRRRTKVPTGIQTPTSHPATAVTMKKKLGEGAFAVVYRVWNVSTGEEYALKKPKPKVFVDLGAWERESLIMDRIYHKHIVSLLDSCPGPEPWLHLEYIREGSIADHLEAGRSFSNYECKQILAQTSDALDYLHALDPQIVHRDVKPNNILISYRRSDAILVKFADFGISREGDTLKSICGTMLYLAPEVYKAMAIPWAERAPYTALVDIWSLGVVLVELLCGLPKRGRRNVEVGWCKSVRQRVEMTLSLKEDDLLSFVLKSMLCLQPKSRNSAKDCSKEALLLLDGITHESSPVSGGHCLDSFQDEASTIRLDKPPNTGSESTDTGNGDDSCNTPSLDSRRNISDSYSSSSVIPRTASSTNPALERTWIKATAMEECLALLGQF